MMRLIMVPSQERIERRALLTTPFPHIINLLEARKVAHINMQLRFDEFLSN